MLPGQRSAFNILCSFLYFFKHLFDFVGSFEMNKAVLHPEGQGATNKENDNGQNN